jgi:hypothetical protein
MLNIKAYLTATQSYDIFKLEQAKIRKPNSAITGYSLKAPVETLFLSRSSAEGVHLSVYPRAAPTNSRA